MAFVRYCPSKLVSKDSELFESWRKDLTSVNAQVGINSVVVG